MGISGFPTPDEIDNAFGFVNPEDRKRWAGTEEDQQKRAGMFKAFANSVSEQAERRGKDRMGAEPVAKQVSERDNRPYTTTRTITEHVTKKIDDDYDY